MSEYAKRLSKHVEPGHCSVELFKQGSIYIVRYGSQSNEFTNVYEAMKEYGECIVHTLTCAGKLDYIEKMN